jgi:hypothetical protein
MHTRRSHLIALLACALLGACVTGAGSQRQAFVSRPPKPPGCDFEFFEDREPPRPYVVLGTLAFNGNQWLGEQGRKEALRETVCQSGADAVLLSAGVERMVGRERIREHEARFVAWSDGPAPQEPQAEPAPAPHPPGTVVVPSSPWMEDTEGTAVQKPAPRS